MGKLHFDCRVCEDVTLCRACYRANTKHAHPFRKGRVGADEAPPANWEELVRRSYMLCVHCGISLLDQSKRAFVDYETNEGEEVYVCLKCRKTHPNPERL